MRGKRTPQRKSRWKMRITPAGAGKTIYRRNSLHLRKDHPRRCGENIRVDGASEIAPGSPPQVRGKLSKYLSIGLQPRITPAGAGKTA